jgi:hypothetical protein
MARLKATHAAELAAQMAALEGRVAGLQAEWEESAAAVQQEVQKATEQAAVTGEATREAVAAAMKQEVQRKKDSAANLVARIWKATQTANEAAAMEVAAATE